MKVAVVGGGFAGLAAAIALQERRHEVTLLERRGVLGGRASSYRDAVSGDDVDNGAHLMFASWTETPDLLRRAGAGDLLHGDPPLRLQWRGPRGLTPLDCPPLPAPLHLAAGFAGMRLPARVRAQAVRYALRAPRPASGTTAAEALQRAGQDAETRAWLWQPLALALLNEPLERADAGLFRAALGESLRGRRGGRPVLLRAGLETLHARLAAYLEARGGRILRRALARRLELRDGRIAGVDYLKRPEERAAIRRAEDPTPGWLPCDAVVCAVPWGALRDLLPAPLAERLPLEALAALPGSPSVTVHLWLDGRVAAQPVVALRDPEAAWLLDRGRLHGRAEPPQHLAVSLVPPAADGPRVPNAERIAAAEAALRRAFPEAEVRVTRALVIQDPAATFPMRPGADSLRPGVATPLRGLALAGDWVEPGRPAGIEAAVRSGRAAARAIETRD